MLAVGHLVDTTHLQRLLNVSTVQNGIFYQVNLYYNEEKQHDSDLENPGELGITNHEIVFVHSTNQLSCKTLFSTQNLT